MDRIFDYFLGKYHDADFILQQKAKILLVLILIGMMSLVLLLLVNIQGGRIDPGFTFPINCRDNLLPGCGSAA